MAKVSWVARKHGAPAFPATEQSFSTGAYGALVTLFKLRLAYCSPGMPKQYSNRQHLEELFTRANCFKQGRHCKAGVCITNAELCNSNMQLCWANRGTWTKVLSLSKVHNQ